MFLADVSAKYNNNDDDDGGAECVCFGLSVSTTVIHTHAQSKVLAGPLRSTGVVLLNDDEASRFVLMGLRG